MSQSLKPRELPDELRAIKERLEKKLDGPFRLWTRQDVSDYLYLLRAERAVSSNLNLKQF
ncbi:hypothetical protein EDD75_0313 [Thermodesulfitimonas autotrophica]|uniref:Uncharacterized protein n=1 Tax=Thermodesulfitimonas autotrophica TaxID=1894989 RepID=A0A3N5AX48_9THEO|nr:hypothetical protein [Thermodesulfitimonas autotrophica]RPF49497.1 hypothetical protein EDD75_0313 [Thermodesulfitimonas autotrophica]